MVNVLSKEAIATILSENHGYIGCEYLHDGSCWLEAAKTGFRSTLRFYRFYIPFHFFPMLIFRRKQMKEKPFQTILRTTWGYTRSLLFLGFFLAVSSIVLCKLAKFNHKNSGMNNFYAAFFGAFSLLFEQEGRRVEVFIYLLSRFFATFWEFMKKRNLVFSIPKGEFFVFALAMGIINCMYQQDESSISYSYLSGFKRFWGKN